MSIDSWRASSMKAQVLTTTRSASSGSSVAAKPSATSGPTSLSESTWFLGHPRVTRWYRDMAPQRYRSAPLRRSPQAADGPVGGGRIGCPSRMELRIDPLTGVQVQVTESRQARPNRPSA